MEHLKNQCRIALNTDVISKQLIEYAISIDITQSILDMLSRSQEAGLRRSDPMVGKKSHTMTVLQVSHYLLLLEEELLSSLLMRADIMDGHLSEMRKSSGKMSDASEMVRQSALMEHISVTIYLISKAIDTALTLCPWQAIRFRVKHSQLFCPVLQEPLLLK